MDRVCVFVYLFTFLGGDAHKYSGICVEARG